MTDTQKALSIRDTAELFGVSELSVRTWIMHDWLLPEEIAAAGPVFSPPLLNGFRRQHEAAILAARGRPGRVLLVDDDDDFRAYLRAAIIELDPAVEIIEAENADIANALLSHAAIDIVFLDFVMPSMSGTSFCRALRENPQYSQTYVIAMTGIQTNRLKDVLLQSGANQVMFKPIELETLEALFDCNASAATHSV